MSSAYTSPRRTDQTNASYQKCINDTTIVRLQSACRSAGTVAANAPYANVPPKNTSSARASEPPARDSSAFGPPHEREVLHRVEEVHHEERFAPRVEAPRHDRADARRRDEPELEHRDRLAAAHAPPRDAEIGRDHRRDRAADHPRDHGATRERFAGNLREHTRDRIVEIGEEGEVADVIDQRRAREHRADVEDLVHREVELAIALGRDTGVAVVDAREAEGLRAGMPDVPERRDHRRGDRDPIRSEQRDEEQERHDDEAQPVTREDRGVRVAAKDHRDEVRVNQHAEPEARGAVAEPRERGVGRGAGERDAEHQRERGRAEKERPVVAG
ncbi:MAG: hypothetical protein R3B99_26405 [Polyangiales bacterium]